MLNRRALFVLIAAPLMACADGTSNEAADGPATLAFSSANELLSWLSARAPDHPGAEVVRRGDGSVLNIRFDDISARDGLFEEFRPYKVIRVAGQDFNADGTPVAAGGDTASAVDVRRSALSSDSTFCSNGLCIEGSSTNLHFSLFGLGYDEVGAATSITSGGTKSYYCPLLVPFTPLQCLAPGYTLTNDPEYTSSCKGGANLFGQSCVKITGTEHVGVTISYYTSVTGSPTVIQTEPVLLTNSGYVGKSYIALGTEYMPCSVSPSLECSVDGVCARHTADTPTASVSGFTNNGPTTCN